MSRKAVIVALGLLLITLFALYAAGVLRAGAFDTAAVVRYCELVAGYPVDRCVLMIMER